MNVKGVPAVSQTVLGATLEMWFLTAAPAAGSNRSPNIFAFVASYYWTTQLSIGNAAFNISIVSIYATEMWSETGIEGPA